MKKSFVGAALTALMLVAPVISEAANFTPTDPSQNYAPTYGHSYAALDNQDGIHLRPASPVSRDPAVVAAPRDSTLRLVNGTGGGG
jgi:hypothetical protein